MRKLAVLLPFFFCACASAPQPDYDLVIRHGTVYDGTGTPGVVQDVAVQRDHIVARGDLGGGRGLQEDDGTGLAVAPGFIDMPNTSRTGQISGGRSQGIIRPGV